MAKKNIPVMYEHTPGDKLPDEFIDGMEAMMGDDVSVTDYDPTVEEWPEHLLPFKDPKARWWEKLRAEGEAERAAWRAAQSKSNAPSGESQSGG